ncbi:MAG: phosphoribosylformylglycinamidine cyclo-ligase [Balneolaceae bacterium]
MAKKSFTYKDAGVDIKEGEELVRSITSVVRETHNEQVLSDIGGFGGLFAPDLSGLKEPVFVSSVDGVGTKLIVAFKSGVFNTVGQDLVNHCVNDIAVCGATPLFFLDYFSTGKLTRMTGEEVITGFAKACKENGVALVGGETAEMPDIYKEGEFDLAGTIVGVVDREKLITGNSIQEGDLLIAVESSGLHTNGYSLARRVLFDQFELQESPGDLGMTIQDVLLAIHKSYLPLISRLRDLSGIHGFSHITGGGIIGNTRRIIPEGLTAEVKWDSWEWPAIFRLIRETGDVSDEEMRSAFNLGAGLVVVANSDCADEVYQAAKQSGDRAFEIGRVTPS